MTATTEGQTTTPSGADVDPLKAIDNVLRYRLTDGDAWSGSLTKARTAVAALIAERDALRRACELAKRDIDYVLKAHPEISGLAIRHDAICALNEVLS